MERQVAFIALFAALVAALGLMPQFMLPFGVPVSAQSLGVMMAGVVLGARRGALSMILFVVLVLAGLPLLAGGRGGLGVLAGPTVGFFLGWPFAAYATGLIVEKWGKGNLLIAGTFASIVGGIFVLYLLGVLGMAVRLDKSFMEARFHGSGLHSGRHHQGFRCRFCSARHRQGTPKRLAVSQLRDLSVDIESGLNLSSIFKAYRHFAALIFERLGKGGSDAFIFINGAPEGLFSWQGEPLPHDLLLRIVGRDRSGIVRYRNADVTCHRPRGSLHTWFGLP